MTASAASPWSARSRPAVKLLAFIGAADGSAPTALTDAAPWLIPIAGDWPSSGGPTLTLQVDLDKLNSRYQDIGVPVGVDRTIELREARNGNVDTLVCWGKLAADAIALNEAQEASTITVQLDPVALELLPLRWRRYYDHVAGAEVDVATDWLFNPREQYTVAGNRSTVQDADGVYYWLDHDSVRTTVAATQQIQNPKRWTIAEAVHTLCWHCNPDEARLTNPELADLQSMLDNQYRDDKFLNHAIPLGATLFEALDQLLQPYSLGWYLRWEGALDEVTTTIAVYELGQGIDQPVRIQRLNDTIDASQNDVADLQLTYDISVQPNRIYAVSGLKQQEVRLSLYPGWDPADDPTGASAGYLDEFDQLAKDPDYQPDGSKSHVGRRWVANEAGEYNGLRTSTASAQPIQGATRLVRRPLLPSLTRGPDGHQIGQRGVLLQWQDFEDEWHDETAPWQVLDDEAGIVYTGLPPIEVWAEYLARGDEYALRVTATVELDDRMTVEAARRSTSPQGRDHWLYLDLSERFAERRLLDTTDQASPFYATRNATLVSAGVDSNGDWVLTLSDTPTGLLPGQKITLLDSEREGVYTVKAVSGVDVTIEESAELVVGSAAATHLVLWNTDAEGCEERLTAFVEKALDDNDYALVSPRIELHGIDHPQYQIGQLVPSAQPRNVSFAGRLGGTRAPQIVGISYQFHQMQRMTLHLEQFVGVMTGGQRATSRGQSVKRRRFVETFDMPQLQNLGGWFA